MPIAEPELIALRLSSYSTWYAASRGYTFGDGVERDLPRLASDAATKLLGEMPGRPAGREGAEIRAARVEASVRGAESAFSSLIDAMIAARPAIYGDDPSRAGIIGEGTLARGLALLCPLWPIC